jgi:hypothetical protein
MDEGVWIIWLMVWSGDFEPNTIKKNRGSMWIKTVTPCPLPVNLHSMSHTFPIAMGLKSASHEAVEKKFAEELYKLRMMGGSHPE